MRKLTIALAVTAIAAAAAAEPVAAQYDRHDGDAYNQGYNEGYRDGYRSGYDDGRAGNRYDDSQYDDNGQSYDRQSGYGPGGDDHDRTDRWRHRYSRTYSYNDDTYYQQCRTSADPGGIIAGALIGGLIGNAVGRGGGQAGATVAGVILGGAAGAAISSNLNCDDRSYAYRSYSDALNSGNAGAKYDWRNPRNGDYGQFAVTNYYNDPDGFRCASYSQWAHTGGHKHKWSGHACQQPDRNWAFID